MRPHKLLGLVCGAAALLGGVGCSGSKATFKANAPGHEAQYGGAFGEATDPYGPFGTYMLERETDTLIVFGAPFPVLAFAWLDAPVVGQQVAAIDFTLHGEAGWLDQELGWNNSRDNWSPDIDAWFAPDAVRYDAAVLSAGRLTFTDAGRPDDEGYPTFKVEGTLVWGNPASADAAWYGWEGKDVWSLRDVPKDL